MSGQNGDVSDSEMDRRIAELAERERADERERMIDEHDEMVRWRRDELVQHLRERGPLSRAELAEMLRVETAVLGKDLEALRVKRLVEKTGEQRSRQGAGGRPSWVYRAVDREAASLPVPEPPQPAQEVVPDRPPAAQEVVPAVEPERTVRDALEARYVAALIARVERREVEPPDHIYDRIERLLGIHSADE